MGIKNWIERLTRAESMWSLWNLLWPYIASLGGAAVIGYLSQGADFVAQLGLFGYATVALLTFFVMSLAFAAIAWARSKWHHPKGAHPEEREVTSQAGVAGGQLKLIKAQKFAHETIELDGKHFLQCKFSQCTFKYNGAPFKIDDCHVSPPNGLYSDREDLARMLDAFITVNGIVRNIEDLGGGRKAIVIPMTTEDAIEEQDAQPQSPQDTPEEKPQ